MEEKEAASTPGRRTRARSAKATTPVVKAEKPVTRKTRKKVVLMEVEVSDEEEETQRETVFDEEQALEGLLNDDGSSNKRRKLSAEFNENKNGCDGSTKVNEEAKNAVTDDKTKEIPKIDEPMDVDLANESKTVIREEQSSVENKDVNGKENTVDKNEAKKTTIEDVNAVVEEIKPDNIQEDKKKVVDEKIQQENIEQTKTVEETPVKEEQKILVEEQKIAKEEQKIVKEEKLKIVKEEEKIVKEEVKIVKEEEKIVKEEGKIVKEEEKIVKEEEKIVKEEVPKEIKEEKSAVALKEEVKVEEQTEPIKEEVKVKEQTEPTKEEVKVKEQTEPTKEELKVKEQPEVVKEEQCTVKEGHKEVKEDKLDKKVVEEEKSDVKGSEMSEEKQQDVKEASKESIAKEQKKIDAKQAVDPDAENISEDELPGVPVVKVPEAEEVSDEELPGPKRAELPADTEVVSEDELPTVKSDKKESKKRKLDQADYDPGSPTSESEAPSKKIATESGSEKEREKSPKPKKLPELDKYWKAVNDDPTDFTGWTYLLQYVDQENDMEAAREAYDAFLSHYPYCYGYWRKYADYEKRKGNKKKCEEVFERGLKAIPLSVDLWLHYLTYVKTTRADEEEYVRSQFERSLTACGLEFRSDRLWDSYIKWESDGKRLQRVTAIYDKLLTTPTQGYTSHFDNFQEHVAANPPNKIIEVDEFLALRKEVRHMLKHDVTTDNGAAEKAETSDAPPGDEEMSKIPSTDEETKAIRERIVSIRRKVHKATVHAVTSRWNYEEGIKRPYFHVKPLERCQLKNWHDYLDYETEQGDQVRIIVLFERCLIACALYEEFWLKFVHYLENAKDQELQMKIRDVYERACTIHHLKKPNLHLQWAMFEEGIGNLSRAAEILVNLEKSLPNVLQIAYRRINLERRRSDFEKCSQLFEHYISNSKNKMISSNIAIKYSRFCFKVMKDLTKAQEVLRTAITKDPNNPRLYLQLIDLTLQKEIIDQSEVLEIIDSFLNRDTTDSDQKVLFAQRKLEYLEDFGNDIQSVQVAHEAYQKYAKLNKENVKKKELKSESTTSNKKEKSTTQAANQASSYPNYGPYGNTQQQTYPYSGTQQGQYNYSQYGQGGDQYQYQNWQYPQGGYGGYNQWGGYGGGYGY